MKFGMTNRYACMTLRDHKQAASKDMDLNKSFSFICDAASNFLNHFKLIFFLELLNEELFCFNAV